MNRVLTILRSLTEEGFSAEYSLKAGVHHIGQGGDCQVLLPHPSASRLHARLTIAGDGSMLLEDLGSTNGTFVDGVPVTAAHPVRPRQTITIGALPLSVTQQAAAPDPDGEGDFDATLPATVVAPPDRTGELPRELTGDQRYEVIRHIARGGMGAVMAALQPAIRREVAMKVVLSGMDSANRMRFIEEAQITG